MRGSPPQFTVLPKPRPEPPRVELPKPVTSHYRVFNCEMEDLQRELNERDPEGNGVVSIIGTFGSAVRVVLKK